MISRETVSSLVTEQIAHIHNDILVARLCQLLVEPYPIDRHWDYGEMGQSFTCWTVLEHRDSNTGIAYCGEGFGPSNPWGLVFLSGDHMGIGMDSGWFPTLEAAMRDSMAWEDPNSD